MGINPKEKAALQAKWAKSKPAAQGRLSTCEWPDGEYQFEVTTWEPDFAKAKVKAGYTIIGGNEAFVGQEHLQFENLTGSEDSMGYFKARLLAFGLAEDDIDALDVEEVLGDTLKKMVLGKKFVGQAKNKNDYLNVYANRPIDGDDTESAESEESEEQTEEGGIQEGSRVTFVSKVDGDQAGEVTAVEGELATVKGDNGKKYKIGVAKLTLEEAESEETSEETEETEETEESEEAEDSAEETNGKKGKLPAVKAILAMKAPELREAFKKLGLKFETVKQPREFLAGVAGFVHDKKYMPPIALLPALSAGLGVKTVKGAKPAEVVKDLRQKALAKFS